MDGPEAPSRSLTKLRVFSALDRYIVFDPHDREAAVRSARQGRRSCRKLGKGARRLSALMLRLGNSLEPVRAPVLAADAVVNEEQAFGVVAPLNLLQARIVGAPERLLPVGFEVVGLRDVGRR